MNPYIFSTLLGGICGGALGYLVTMVRGAPVFGIVSGIICGMLIGPGLLADLRRVEKNRLQQEYESRQIKAAKK